jgi:cysteine-rich repeat protein
MSFNGVHKYVFWFALLLVGFPLSQAQAADPLQSTGGTSAAGGTKFYGTSGSSTAGSTSSTSSTSAATGYGFANQTYSTAATAAANAYYGNTQMTQATTAGSDGADAANLMFEMTATTTATSQPAGGSGQCDNSHKEGDPVFGKPCFVWHCNTFQKRWDHMANAGASCSNNPTACIYGMCDPKGVCMDNVEKPKEDGATCKAPEIGDWSTCSYSSPCDRSKEKKRDIKTFQCRQGSCIGKVTDHETNTCQTRNTDGDDCDNGDKCDGIKTCNNGLCKQTTGPIVCTASDQCHNAGICNPQNGICPPSTPKNSGSCSDSNACTTGESCSQGSCQGGAPLSNIDDLNACTNDTCNTQTGAISHVADANLNPGTCCVTNNDCNDSDSCTQDTCNQTTHTCQHTFDASLGSQCCSNNSDCNDGQHCNGAETCNQTTKRCVDGITPNCNDSNACTNDSCNEGTNTCDNNSIPGCCNSNADCDDSLYCNGAETCNTSTHTCVAGSAISCASSGDQCNNGICDEATDSCKKTPKSDTPSCDDGNACTQTDTCQSGSCTGSDPVVCPAPDQCHNQGTCNTNTGACNDPIKVNGTTCNDNQAHTLNDQCTSGICGGTDTPPSCALSCPETVPAGTDVSNIIATFNGTPVESIDCTASPESGSDDLIQNSFNNTQSAYLLENIQEDTTITCNVDGAGGSTPDCDTCEIKVASCGVSCMQISTGSNTVVAGTKATTDCTITLPTSLEGSITIDTADDDVVDNDDLVLGSNGSTLSVATDINALTPSGERSLCIEYTFNDFTGNVNPGCCGTIKIVDPAPDCPITLATLGTIYADQAVDFDYMITNATGASISINGDTPQDITDLTTETGVVSSAIPGLNTVTITTARLNVVLDDNNNQVTQTKDCTLTFTTIDSTCGDGFQASHELCDDGNTTDGDGCDSNCTPTGCGNHIETSGETCDDGNTINNDGCSNTCQIEVCGDGIPQDNEECEDGNTDNGDGCNSQCIIEPTCSVQNVSTGIISYGESISFDLYGQADHIYVHDYNDNEVLHIPNFISPSIAVPHTVTCTAGLTSLTITAVDDSIADDYDCDGGIGIPVDCRPVCGNETVNDGEQCDPPNGTTCDSSCQTICPADTTKDDAGNCTPNPQTIVCADGVTEVADRADCPTTPETCPDGSPRDDNGNCPDPTIPPTAGVCGDKVIDPGEECDPPGEEIAGRGTCDDKCQIDPCLWAQKGSDAYECCKIAHAVSVMGGQDTQNSIQLKHSFTSNMYNHNRYVVQYQDNNPSQVANQSHLFMSTYDPSHSPGPTPGSPASQEANQEGAENTGYEYANRLSMPTEEEIPQGETVTREPGGQMIYTNGSDPMATPEDRIARTPFYECCMMKKETGIGIDAKLAFKYLDMVDNLKTSRSKQITKSKTKALTIDKEEIQLFTEIRNELKSQMLACECRDLRLRYGGTDASCVEETSCIPPQVVDHRLNAYQTYRPILAANGISNFTANIRPYAPAKQMMQEADIKKQDPQALIQGKIAQFKVRSQRPTYDTILNRFYRPTYTFSKNVCECPDPQTPPDKKAFRAYLKKIAESQGHDNSSLALALGSGANVNLGSLKSRSTDPYVVTQQKMKMISLISNNLENLPCIHIDQVKALQDAQRFKYITAEIDEEHQIVIIKPAPIQDKMHYRIDMKLEQKMMQKGEELKYSTGSEQLKAHSIKSPAPSSQMPIEINPIILPLCQCAPADDDDPDPIIPPENIIGFGGDDGNDGSEENGVEGTGGLTIEELINRASQSGGKNALLCGVLEMDTKVVCADGRSFHLPEKAPLRDLKKVHTSNGPLAAAFQQYLDSPNEDHRTAMAQNLVTTFEQSIKEPEKFMIMGAEIPVLPKGGDKNMDITDQVKVMGELNPPVAVAEWLNPETGKINMNKEGKIKVGLPTGPKEPKGPTGPPPGQQDGEEDGPGGKGPGGNGPPPHAGGPGSGGPGGTGHHPDGEEPIPEEEVEVDWVDGMMALSVGSEVSTAASADTSADSIADQIDQAGIQIITQMGAQGAGFCQLQPQIRTQSSPVYWFFGLFVLMILGGLRVRVYNPRSRR